MKTEDTIVRTPEEAIETIKSNMPISGYQMLRESLNMAIEALEEIQQYREIGTVEECREAVEKQRPVSRIIIEGKLFCPKCKNLMPYPGYCGCGQRID